MKSKPIVKIGMCALNNDPLQFDKNLQKIIKSIQKCKQMGCTIRTGGQLEISGYSCFQHFHQLDTIDHSWNVIADILKTNITKDIVCDIGTAVIHHGKVYNTKIILYDGKVVGIRVKLYMADSNNYFQTKWFSSWPAIKQVCDYKLPVEIQQLTGQEFCPIGDFVIEFNDTTLGFQICQESWIPCHPCIDQALDGVEITLNGSATVSERGKLERKLRMYRQFNARHGTAYLYTNIKGAVGDRTYIDGGCIFAQNGQIKALSQLLTLQNVLVTLAEVDLRKIRTNQISDQSFGKGAQGIEVYPRIKVKFTVGTQPVAKSAEKIEEQKDTLKKLLDQYQCKFATYEPSLYLWDYLKKSKASGFFLTLSGDLQSCAVALIVFNMCFLVLQQIKYKKNQQTLQQLQRVVNDSNYIPETPIDICNKIFYTACMETDKQSIKLAQQIAKFLNINHQCFDTDKITQQYEEVINKNLGINLKKEGYFTQNIKNMKSRSKMVLSYLLSQIQLKKVNKNGFLLVLGSSNLCEQLIGNFAKYNCSSGDFNPIASFSKKMVRQFVQWNFKMSQFPFIQKVLNNTPIAEFKFHKIDITKEYVNLTENQLDLFGNLRMVKKLGPVSMFQHLYQNTFDNNPQLIGEKVKIFFKQYSMNRHKILTITPGFHYNPQDCDNTRYDMRPTMYATEWNYQFNIIDKRIKEIQKNKKQQ